VTLKTKNEPQRNLLKRDYYKLFTPQPLPKRFGEGRKLFGEGEVVM
jgi:hypothetical protein